MTTMNRRNLCVALSSFVTLASAVAAGQATHQGEATDAMPPETMAPPAPPGSPGDAVLNQPRAFRFEQLPVAKSANGESRAVIRGVLPTGEAVELHETTLLPGHMPHPAHRHRHSEFMMVREGELEFDNDGRPERVGPGGVIFAASNIMHGLKNVGTAPANYFVLAIGRET